MYDTEFYSILFNTTEVIENENVWNYDLQLLSGLQKVGLGLGLQVLAKTRR